MDKSGLEEQVRNALDGLCVRYEFRDFPDGTRTSRDAALAIGCELGQIAKSIAFESGKGPVLVIASGCNRIDTDKVGRKVGSQVKIMGPERVLEVTGFPVGGVPPVSLKSRMQVLIDQDLLKYPIIWAAGGSQTTVFSISPKELVRIAGGQVADVRE